MRDRIWCWCVTALHVKPALCLVHNILNMYSEFGDTTVLLWCIKAPTLTRAWTQVRTLAWTRVRARERGCGRGRGLGCWCKCRLGCRHGRRRGCRHRCGYIFQYLIIESGASVRLRVETNLIESGAGIVD